MATKKTVATKPAKTGKIVNRAERQRKLTALMSEMIDVLGLDRTDPNLAETDRRVAEMYMEMFSGCDQGAEPKITTFPNDGKYTTMVIEKDMPFYSICSHHFVPFYGRAHVGYIPGTRLVGLSKIPRILDFYARRPQLQERLTEQIAAYFTTKLQPQGVIVVIEARHLCVEMRGVKKPGALTVTSAIRGMFENRSTREEFLDLLNRQG